MNYTHVRCGYCGGIIRMSNLEFVCEDCGEKIYLRGTDFDRLMVNDKTGWIFPMIYKGEKHDNKR